MYGHKWWLCWKISVQCGRELSFLHSDITVIILHCQILILYNWRPYLSITPRISIRWIVDVRFGTSLSIFLLWRWYRATGLGDRRTNPGRQVYRTMNFCTVKVEGKVHTLTCHVGPEGGGVIKENLYSFLILAMYWGRWSNAMPRPLNSRERYPVPTVPEVGRVYTGAENLALTASRSPDRPARRK